MTAQLGGISFSIGVDLSTLRQGLREAEGEVTKFQGFLNSATASLASVAKDSGQVGTLAGVLATLTQQAAEAAKALQSVAMQAQMAGGKVTGFANKVSSAGDQAKSSLQGVATQAVATGNAVQQMGQMAQGAGQGLNAGLGGAQIAAMQLAAQFKTTGQQAGQMGQQTTTAGQQAAAAVPPVNQLTAAVGALGEVAAAIGAGYLSKQLGGFLIDATTLAGRVENLGTVVKNVGQNAGYSIPQLQAFEERIKALNITTEAARQVLALMAQSELDLSQASKLARIAQDAAVISGKNSSEATEQLVVGIQRTNTWMLRQLGILVNLRQVYEEYTHATGRTIDELTASEKQQILLNKVLEEGTKITGTYEAALGDAYKQLTSLQRVWEESKRVLGEQFIPVLALAVKSANAFLEFWKHTEPATKAAVAGLAAAITVMLSLASAVAVAGAALKVFSIELVAANLAAGTTAVTVGSLAATFFPWILAVGAAAGILVYLAAQQRNAREEAEKHTSTIKSEEQAIRDLAEAIQVIEMLGHQTNLTQDQQAQLNKAIEAAKAILPGYEGEINNLSGDLAELAITLKKIKPEAGVSTEEHIKKLRVELEEAEKAAKAFQDSLISERLKKFFTFRSMGDADNALEALQKKVEDAKTKIVGAEEAAGTGLTRQLRQLVKDSSIATDQATELEAEYANNRRKLYKDANLEIYEEWKTLQDKISKKALQSEEQIDAVVSDFESSKRKKFQETFDLRVKGLDKNSSDYKKAQEDLQRSLSTVAPEAKKYKDTLSDELHQRKVAEAGIEQDLNTRVLKKEQETARLKDKNARKEAGEDEKLLDLEEKMQALKENAAIIDERAASLNAGLDAQVLTRKKELTDATERVKRDSSNKGLVIDQQVAETQLKYAQEAQRKLSEAVGRSAAENAQEQLAAQLEYQERSEKLAEDQKKELEKQYSDLMNTLGDSAKGVAKAAAKDAKEILKGIEDDLKETQKKLEHLVDLKKEVDVSLEQKQAELGNKYTPGIQQAFSIFSEYRELITKAQDEDQLAKILSYSREEYSQFVAEKRKDGKLSKELVSTIDEYLYKISGAVKKRKEELKDGDSIVNLRRQEVALQDELNDQLKKRKDQEESIRKLLEAQLELIHKQIEAIKKGAKREAPGTPSTEQPKTPYTEDLKLAPEQEKAFQDWYKKYSKELDLDPNPDAPEHKYFYRRAFQAGKGPNDEGHWPSDFKAADHPNRYVDGQDTITGRPVLPKSFEDKGIKFTQNRDGTYSAALPTGGTAKVSPEAIDNAFRTRVNFDELPKTKNYFSPPGQQEQEEEDRAPAQLPIQPPPPIAPPVPQYQQSPGLEQLDTSFLNATTNLQQFSSTVQAAAQALRNLGTQDVATEASPALQQLTLETSGLRDAETNRGNSMQSFLQEATDTLQQTALQVNKQAEDLERMRVEIQKVKANTSKGLKDSGL